jgi:hypothetical protein
MIFAFYTNLLWDIGLIGIQRMPEKKTVWPMPNTGNQQRNQFRCRKLKYPEFRGSLK